MVGEQVRAYAPRDDEFECSDSSSNNENHLQDKMYQTQDSPFNQIKLISQMQAIDSLVKCGEDTQGRLLLVKPVELEEQEVVCQNCFEAFSMLEVDDHS